MTIRSLEPAPDAITALWKERGLERIELQPLGPPDVRRLVASLLAGAVHTAAHERIYDLSQGNPLYIHELVHDAGEPERCASATADGTGAKSS